MNDGTRDRERAFWRAYHPGAEPEWEDVWPTESRGNGRVRKNNSRTGAAQGKSSLVRKAPCRLCGFPNDLSRIDHSGGSIDGNGAGGAIATFVGTTTLPNGTIHTENYGSQSYRGSAGCALCFSKNSTLIRRDVASDVNPWDRIQTLGY